MKRVWMIALVVAIAVVWSASQLAVSAQASVAGSIAISAGETVNPSGDDRGLKQTPSWWAAKEDANGNAVARENQFDDDDDDDDDYDDYD